MNIHDWLDSLGPDWEAAFEGVTHLGSHLREVSAQLAMRGVPDGVGGSRLVDADAVVFIEVEGRALYRGDLAGVPTEPCLAHADADPASAPTGSRCVHWAVFLGARGAKTGGPSKTR
ncbi:MAG: hypothetical protein VKQ33_08905 [Candidatus Sericytochromatia bacterium]|nr:hypothetical protein [Candidatus Sericytochromatia bacterium]